MSQVEAYSRLAGVYDEIVVDPCYDSWASYLHDVWRTDSVPVRSVLDVGCGTGLLAAELVRLGYGVVGVDSSAAMLARARQLLGSDVVLVRMTLPDLTVGGVFDAAVSTFDALNYLDPAELRATVAVIAEHLRPGGWLVFDLHTDAMMELTATDPVVAGTQDGNRFEISSVVDVDARTCLTRIDVTRLSDGDTFTEQHSQYFHSDTDVGAALAAGGLEVVAVTDEYTAAPVDASTLRATWTARTTGSA